MLTSPPASKLPRQHVTALSGGHSLVSDVIVAPLGHVVRLDVGNQFEALQHAEAGRGDCVVDEHSLDRTLQSLLGFGGRCSPLLPGDDGH